MPPVIEYNFPHYRWHYMHTFIIPQKYKILTNLTQNPTLSLKFALIPRNLYKRAHITVFATLVLLSYMVYIRTCICTCATLHKGISACWCIPQGWYTRRVSLKALSRYSVWPLKPLNGLRKSIHLSFSLLAYNVIPTENVILCISFVAFLDSYLIHFDTM